jgi:hypothetical protein
MHSDSVEMRSDLDENAFRFGKTKMHSDSDEMLPHRFDMLPENQIRLSIS